MKKIIIILICLCIPSISNGQEIIQPQNIQEIQQKIEEKKIFFEEQIKTKQKEIEIQRASTTPDLISGILTQSKLIEETTYTFSALEAILIRFEGIIYRLEIRISKLEEQGVDTTDTRKLLDKTKKSLEDSYILILASKAQNQIDFSKTIDAQVIKNNTDECKESLKIVQQNLLTIVQNLKQTEPESTN